MKKIYFAGSIRGGREDVEIYRGIVEHLKTYGNVLTEHVADKSLALMGEDSLSDKQIHYRDMDLLTDANFVVAEVTKVSLGVGYEIGRIVERNLWIPGNIGRKPILCLYRFQIDKRLSAMIAGSPTLSHFEYENLEQAKSGIDDFFDSIT